MSLKEKDNEIAELRLKVLNLLNHQDTNFNDGFQFCLKEQERKVAELKKKGLERAKHFVMGKTTSEVIYVLTSKDFQDVFEKRLG